MCKIGNSQSLCNNIIIKVFLIKNSVVITGAQLRADKNSEIFVLTSKVSSVVECRGNHSALFRSIARVNSIYTYIKRKHAA